MKISQRLKEQEITVSFELFPPKEGSKLTEYKGIARQVAALNPSFISVTYGASGGTSEYTAQVAREVMDCGVPALAHLTCASSTHEQVRAVLDNLKAIGVENILALRGDIPADAAFPLPNQYKYASELISEIRSYGDFCIGAACYPESHPESASRKEDIDNLKRKVDAGVDFLTTQMFFDNGILYNFLYRCLRAGIDVPVCAGIMPICDPKQVKRAIALSGSIMPPRFAAIADRFAHDPDAMAQAGIAYATEQIIDLVANGITNIHLYTMNKPWVTQAIMNNLSAIIHTEA